MDDLSGFSKTTDKDWKENLYSGPGMPPLDAQRNVREPTYWQATKEFVVVVFALLSPILVLALLGFLVWDLFLR